MYVQNNDAKEQKISLKRQYFNVFTKSEFLRNF